ncbi:MAG: DUF1353 domain-containing protein [Phycisphaerales bacterium]|nr:DUF1353 domain-containing protein [Phycisphaerales bacterium]
MAGFLSPLAIREIEGDERHWILLEPCVYHLGDEHGEEWIEAPVTFVTDFGSIPQMFWNLPGLSPFGKYRRAYVIHDKLYVAPVVRSETNARVIDRGEVDGILKEALGVLGANWMTRQTIWSAVRVGGRFPWNCYRHSDRVAAEGSNV